MEPLLSNNSSSPLRLEEKHGCPGSYGYHLIQKHVSGMKQKKALRKEQFRAVKTVKRIAKEKHTTLPVELRFAQESYRHLLQLQKETDGKQLSAV